MGRRYIPSLYPRIFVESNDGKTPHVHGSDNRINAWVFVRPNMERQHGAFGYIVNGSFIYVEVAGAEEHHFVEWTTPEHRWYTSRYAEIPNKGIFIPEDVMNRGL